MRPALFAAAAVCVLGLFAAKTAAEPKKTIRLEEVLSVGGRESDLLSMWVGVAADGTGCLYVTDALEASLKKFGPDGCLMKTAAWMLSGKGAFGVRRYPVDVSGGSVFVVVSDPFRSSIKEFDAGLNFKASIPLPCPADDLQAFPDGRLAYSTVSLRKEDAGTIRVIDRSGRLKRIFSCRRRDDPPAMSPIDFRFGADGSLYVVFNYLDRLLKLDARGRLLWAKSLLGVSEIRTKKILFHTVPETPTFKDIAVDGQGRLFVLGGGYSRHRSRDVYVLDSDGRLLDTLILPQPSHCLMIDGRGCLYARADQGMTLKKYRIMGPESDDERR
ncbi:MAG: hypothetical protein JW747_02215 [Candidatus Aminicenantes bacterium]|nr:hypothetical protein [Candidatus Aminicenantes bacterium]